MTKLLTVVTGGRWAYGGELKRVSFCIASFWIAWIFLIAMKVFDKGNPGTMYRYNTGFLAGVKTPPGSPTALFTVAYTPWPSTHCLHPTSGFPPCCLFPCPLPSLQSSARNSWLARPARHLSYPTKTHPHRIPLHQLSSLPQLAVMFDRWLHKKVVMTGLMPIFPAPWNRF